MESPVETEDLVEQAKQGSHESFADLVRLHHATVRTFLSRFLRNSAAVDDLAQEVFLVAFRRLEDYRGEAPFPSWLMGVARNQALTHLRSESRRRKRDRDFFESAVSDWQADRLDQVVATAEEQDRSMAALRACVESLPPASREVVDRFYFEDETTEAIAERLNKKNGAVRMMLLRVRKALGKCVTAKLGREAE